MGKIELPLYYDALALDAGGRRDPNVGARPLRTESATFTGDFTDCDD